MRPARFVNNSILAWTFAGGIPREIKRNVILCAANGLNLLDADHFDVWLLLFRDLLEAQEAWALVLSKENDISYQFLRCLDETRQRLPLKPAAGREAVRWYEEMLTVWAAYYKLSFIQPDATTRDAATTAAAAGEGRQTLFERSVFELAIGAVALLVVADGGGGDERPDDRLKELLEIFTLISYSPAYAGYKFHQLLKNIGIAEEIKPTPPEEAVKPVYA
jgi:hypothetical protein